jgi:hypothetical protein
MYADNLKKGIFLSLLSASSLPAMTLDESCKVTIMNRTVQVSAEGGWFLPNVPSFMYMGSGLVYGGSGLAFCLTPLC